MKIFLAIPTENKNKEEISSSLTQIKKEIINKLNNDNNNNIEFLEPSYNEELESLAENINKMDKADIAYFGRNWRMSRDCNVEYNIAQMYGKDILQAGEVLGPQNLL